MTERAVRSKQTPASRRTLGSVMVGLLRDRILDGRFAPGMQLNEVELAGHFAVSRGPLRQAMQELVTEGLLVHYPHRGVFVPEVTRENLEDVRFVRSALERAALRRVLSGGVPATLVADLATIVDRMAVAATAEDRHELAALDLAFHRCLVTATGSPRLQRQFDLLTNEMRLCLRAVVGTYPDGAELREQHRRLLTAIAGGDRAAALRQLDLHFDDEDDIEAAATGSARRPPRHLNHHPPVDDAAMGAPSPERTEGPGDCRTSDTRSHGQNREHR